jgi:pyruvate dehydrogenase E2 component (dihydrolipoamide acetyltransferase)
MSEQEIKVPDLGGADEVEVIEILVNKGDLVEEEDPILTVESDKASVELPSPGAGKVTKITVKVGDKVKEGDVVGLMEASSDTGASGDKDSSYKAESSDQEKKAETTSADKAEKKPAPKMSGGSRQETLKVPALDGFDNVPIIEINVSEGDEVAADDPLVTVESDKATMEIPSPYAGKVGKILVKEGDKLSEGHDLLEMTVVEEGGDSGEGDSGEEDENSSEPQSSSEDDKPQSKPEPKG